MRTPSTLARAAALAAAGLLTSLSHADTFDFTVVQQDSSAQADVATSVDIINGTIIGDYDPDTNPDGTRTRLTLFGSGNHPVPFTGEVEAEGDSDTNPTGTFSITIDDFAGQAVLSGLTMDLLAGDEPEIPVSAELLYQTFYTSNPDSVFPGGSPVPVPLGEATITRLDVSQPDDAAGTLEQTAPGVYEISIDATLLVELSVAMLDQTFDAEPLPIVVRIDGTLTVDGDDATFVTAFDIEFSEVNTDTIDGPRDVPFDLPTVLPSGEIAHVLISFDLTNLAASVDAVIDLVADGQKPGCPADWNGDGVVDSDDLFDFLADWAAGDADFNGDGVTDSDDLFDFLGAWSNPNQFPGC